MSDLNTVLGSFRITTELVNSKSWMIFIGLKEDMLINCSHSLENRVYLRKKETSLTASVKMQGSRGTDHVKQVRINQCLGEK